MLVATNEVGTNLLGDFRLGFVRRDYIGSRFGKGENFAAKLGLRGVSKAAYPILSRVQYWREYAQHYWRVGARLTLNFRLRWEGTTLRIEDHNRMNSFDMTATSPASNTPGVVTFAGLAGTPRPAYDFAGNNSGPRMGFAWLVRDKTLVRGGGGVVHGAPALGFSTGSRIASTRPGITLETVFRFASNANAFLAGPSGADHLSDRTLPTGERTLARGFNASAFGAPTPYRLGTGGRGILTGPGSWNIDSSVNNKFPNREGWHAEPRAGFYNLLNHPNFGLPGHSAGSPNFGVISSASAARSNQPAARIEFHPGSRLEAARNTRH
ncbi:MAG: hypothetical protein LC130_19995 [Bryobacterales bacterium]|nr:hypothetical protein [Bryobacterales bacterium]